MEVSKIKNITIVALLLINVFFLSMIITDAVKEKKNERELLASIVSAYEKFGITVDEKEIVTNGQLASYNAVRDYGLEEQTAKTLLGNPTLTEQGGNIRLYESDSGTATFRESGDFSAELTHLAADSGSAEARAVKLADSIPVETGKAVISDDGTTVTVPCCLGGVEIYNCKIVFTFDGDALITVSGRLPQSINGTGGTAAGISVYSAMMKLLSEAKSGNAAFKNVSGAEMVYMSTYSVLGESSLIPFWKISTNDGNYLINAISGDLET